MVHGVGFWVFRVFWPSVQGVGSGVWGLPLGVQRIRTFSGTWV